ncbi:50S ribosomal protein L34 [Brevundimonas vesicularis]
MAPPPTAPCAPCARPRPSTCRRASPAGSIARLSTPNGRAVIARREAGL